MLMPKQRVVKAVALYLPTYRKIIKIKNHFELEDGKVYTMNETIDRMSDEILHIFNEEDKNEEKSESFD